MTKLKAIIDELADTAMRAVDHVGKANYASRQSEANNWIAVARNEAIRKVAVLNRDRQAKAVVNRD